MSLASQGFVNAAGQPSIVPLAPQNGGCQSIVFNSFSIGTNTNELKQVNNTYQIRTASREVSARIPSSSGRDFIMIRSTQIRLRNSMEISSFTGSETGDDFADFLIGAPSQYNQSQLNFFYSRNKYVGAYTQDSWR